MVKVEQAVVPRDALGIHTLFTEYGDWLNVRSIAEYGVSLDVQAMVEHNMSTLDKFMPPQGRLLLAYSDGQLAGVACLRRIDATIAEVKRVYVRPACRGHGLGRILVNELIVEAQEAGYQWLRLDSVRFMHEAHHLYRSLGFQEIEPYAESEIPQEYWSRGIFMQRELA